MKVKKWNGSAWVQDYPEVNVSSIVATGTPSGSTFLRGDGAWAAVTATDNTKLPLAGGTITLASGTTSNTIYFNTAQTFVGPYLRGSVQNLQRGYYTNSYTIWDSGNHGAGSGLDADLLDGNQQDTNGTANTIVRRDASGYIRASYYNSSRGDETSAAASYIYDSGDGWIRKKTLANARTELVTSSAVTTALGFTPYNSSNPSGYLTSSSGLNASNLTSGTVPAARIPNAGTTTVGGVKVRLSGSTLYITNNGNNP